MSLITPARIDPNAASNLLLRARVAKRDVSKLLPEVRAAAGEIRKALGASREKVAEATGGHVTVPRLAAMEHADSPAMPTLDEAVALAEWIAQAAGVSQPPPDDAIESSDEALPDLPEAG